MNHLRAIRRPPLACPRGFTLIEALAALLLVAIVIPAIMRAVYVSTQTALAAQRHTEAAALAEQKLNEIVATGEWQTPSLSGDFGRDWPLYRWSCLTQAWAADTTTVGLQEVDLTVTWNTRNRPESLTLSTLTYLRGQSQ